MNKKVLLSILSLFLFIGIGNAQNKAVITVKDAIHDFGKIKESNGKVSHVFTVSNTGNAPLVITRVMVSCGCTSPSYSKEPILPGKTGEITVTFNPKGRVSPFTKTISVYSNGKEGPVILTIKGIVTE